MRLWIVLDEKIDQQLISPSDYLISLEPNADKLYTNCIVLPIDRNCANLDESLFYAMNNMFAYNNKDIRTLMNPMYARIFKPVASIVNQVDTYVKEFCITELILTGGCQAPFFTIRHGEGEGKKICFKSSWLINPFLYYKYADNNQISVIWNSKKNQLIYRLLHFVRENAFFVKTIIDSIISNKRSRNSHTILDNSLNRPVIVAYSQKKLQLRHLRELFQHINNGKVIFLNSSSSDEESLRITPLSIKEMFQLYFETIKAFDSCNDFYFNWNGIHLLIPNKIIKRTAKTQLLLHKLEVAAIKKTLCDYRIDPDYLITNMTFGGDLQSIDNLCKQIGAVHYNFQYVAMNRLLYPQMDLADRYYVYSKKVYELNKKYSSSYRLYLPVKERRNNILKSPIEITIFTQPDWYAQRYYDFIIDLCEAIMNKGISVHVNIKPHYRQNKLELFTSLEKKYEFISLIEKDKTVNELLNSSNFALSMTSSVLFEAMTIGTPGIIIDIDGLDSESITNNDVGVEEVNFRCNSLSEIICLITDADNTIKRYAERRANYIKESHAIVDVNSVFER